MSNSNEYTINDYFDWTIGDDFLNKLHSPHLFFEKVKSARNLLTDIENTAETFFNEEFIPLYLNGEHSTKSESINSVVAQIIIKERRGEDFIDFIFSKGYESEPIIKDILFNLRKDPMLKKAIELKDMNNSYRQKYLNLFPKINAIANFSQSMSFEEFEENFKEFTCFHFNAQELLKFVPTPYIHKHSNSFYERILKTYLPNNSMRGFVELFYSTNDLLKEVLNGMSDEYYEEALQSTVNQIKSTTSSIAPPTDYNEKLKITKQINLFSFMVKTRSVVGGQYLTKLIDAETSSILFNTLQDNFSMTQPYADEICNAFKAVIKNNKDLLSDKNFCRNVSNATLSGIIIDSIIEENITINKSNENNYNPQVFSSYYWKYKANAKNLKNAETLDFINSKITILKYTMLVSDLIKEKKYDLAAIGLKYKENRIPSVYLPIIENTEIPNKILSKILEENSNNYGDILKIIEKKPSLTNFILTKVKDKNNFMLVLSDYKTLIESLPLDTKEQIENFKRNII